jgi:hypothetical protein
MRLAHHSPAPQRRPLPFRSQSRLRTLLVVTRIDARKASRETLFEVELHLTTDLNALRLR